MKFHTGTIQFRMLNGTEVFFSFQTGLSIVGDCFHLVEELFFKRQCFISAKNNQIYFRYFTDYNELNLTILSSKYGKILTLNLY